MAEDRYSYGVFLELTSIWNCDYVRAEARTLQQKFPQPIVAAAQVGRKAQDKPGRCIRRAGV